ncbi:lysophospholipase L1-like esterase [Kineococcus radiotolerans]|uniref:Lysophospholipase L1-like esterase n=1 Tax=Kineococcus radiotolerans TaxID=131568 RepID=A0A7W4TQC4_KINRA|nr:GDSL-type esterase/lipase family protein [Kineococcus radiotolerans]MBB2903171.1 lysophospholipase L1-like esterase [Kineococcus radiotolerans]
MTSQTPDVRICFVGDSFVAGAGDPQHLGWAGRLAAHSHTKGQPLTSYNLGVRRDTSSDVLTRWHTECTPRLPAGCRAGVVLSFGVNDTTLEGGTLRTAPDVSAANLHILLTQARSTAWPVLVAGPPAVDDEKQNERTAVVDVLFAQVCAQHQVPYVSVLPALRAHPLWRRQVREGDGAHPDDEGYQALTALLLPAWQTWYTTVRSGSSHP